MGCDIHGYVEVKIDDKWYAQDRISCDRWYALFEKIAGVRGDVSNAISPPKGIPNDVSIVAKLDVENMGMDAHSKTWLSKGEIKELQEWTENVRSRVDCWFETNLGWLYGDGLVDSEINPPEVEDFRLVLWFDS